MCMGARATATAVLRKRTTTPLQVPLVASLRLAHGNSKLIEIPMRGTAINDLQRKEISSKNLTHLLCPEALLLLPDAQVA
jgi:hypothetical protein